jgi:tetratricopeptide (TPR) repeat protein
VRPRDAKCFLTILVLECSMSLNGQAQQETLPYCGSGNAGPHAAQGDGKNRPCDTNGQRRYVPHHKGVGFDILDSESHACFVPDQEYRLLDELVDTILSKVKYDPASTSPLEQAKMISAAVSDVLLDKGFALYIDTETLGDALVDRNATGQSPRRIFDCDTGSLIFLTVAENLAAPVVMVEMPLAQSKNHHNFVRWLQREETLLEWDMNLRSQCKAPPGLSGFEGKSMNREETIGYALSLRPNLWNRQKQYDRALTDFHTSMIFYQGSDVYNNLAWLIATREVSNREVLKDEALTAARRAIQIWPSANYMDTLACVYALRGDFPTAIKTEEEALAQTNDPDYERHLTLFRIVPPKDCTGE